MKHLITRTSTTPGIRDSLLAILSELRETKFAAAEQGIATIEFGDTIEVTMEVVATGGLNGIERASVNKSGAQVTRQTSPAVTETSERGEEISEETAAATVTVDEGEKEHSQYTVNGSNGGDTVQTDQSIEE